MFPGKFKSKWTGPFLVTKLFPYGSVEMENKEGARFTINRQRTNMPMKLLRYINLMKSE